MRPVDKYLSRQDTLARWGLQGDADHRADAVVVIPALAESENLAACLDALAANPPHELDRTIVLTVVNNPPAADTPRDVSEDNLRTLDLLAERHAADADPLRLAWVDAASPGHELPARQAGVGLARKIGLDWGLHILAATSTLDGPLLCLDADTWVEPGYLESVHRFFADTDYSAAAIAYAHRLNDDPRSRVAIAAYELYLRYYVAGMRYAQSPYAYHAIGSTMACRASAYAAVSGMPTRQAGEDFYFLQKLSKHGGVGIVDTTTVHPSSRLSGRVPFGTGRALIRYTQGEDDPFVTYHPHSFELLRRWIADAMQKPEASGERLAADAAAIHPELAAFLKMMRFAQGWDAIRANTAAPGQLPPRFHEFFDGFRTLKLVHHLRDTALGQAPLLDALDHARRYWPISPPETERLDALLKVVGPGGHA